ncbi:hypothetical protein NL676_018055 [Syzygium grande]|nr:hypothetical protein NL676_018055 [Syzygium grande]
MMATLTTIAIAIASSSIAIRPFCAHQPSFAPDLGEVEQSRPWPPLDLAHGCSTSLSPRSGRRRGEKEENGEEHAGEEASRFDFRSAHVVGDSASPRFDRTQFGFLLLQCSPSPAFGWDQKVVFGGPSDCREI